MAYQAVDCPNCNQAALMKPSNHWNPQPNISNHPGWELRTKLIFLCQWLSVMEKILYIPSGAFSLRPTQA